MSRARALRGPPAAASDAPQPSSAGQLGSEAAAQAPPRQRRIAAAVPTPLRFGQSLANTASGTMGKARALDPHRYCRRCANIRAVTRRYIPIKRCPPLRAKLLRWHR